MVVQYALRGLEYLHFKRKIHRDIKAGNILLNLEGHAKLGQFFLASFPVPVACGRRVCVCVVCVCVCVCHCMGVCLSSCFLLAFTYSRFWGCWTANSELDLTASTVLCEV